MYKIQMIVLQERRPSNMHIVFSITHKMEKIVI